MNRLTATNRLNDGGRLLVENPQAADLDVPLTNSIIPQRSVGAVSYSRATIATVTDHEGVMRNCIAGEARFQGARRVQNLLSFSESADNAYWSKGYATITANSAIAPDGKATADTLVGTGGSIGYYIRSISVISGHQYCSSFYAKAINISNARLTTIEQSGSCIFDLSSGTVISTAGIASSGSITSVGNGWYRCSAIFTANATGANQFAFFANSAFVGDQIYTWGMQLEDVTGQSIQTPGEYVSTNVLTTAPFHGANVDGVKYFNTTLAGLPISPSTLKGFLCEGARTNLCNYSNIAVAGWGLISSTRTDNAGIAPDGTNSFVKIIPNAGTQSSYAYNVNITTTAQVYALSCYVKASGLNFVQLRFGAAISSGYANFDLLNGVVGTISLWTSSGIEAVTGFPGVYRIWAVTDTVLAATAEIAIQIVPAANSGTGAPVTGDGVSGVMAWGMQIEAGVNVSTYIPTVASTVTRNIDVLTYDVKNVIANQGAFSAVLSMNDYLLSDRRPLNFSGSNNNRFQFQVKNLGIPNVYFGDGAAVRTVTSTQVVGTNNIAVAWTNGISVDMYMNNTKYSSANTPNLIFSTIDVGGLGAVGYSLFGYIKNLRIWKTRPTDAELLLLSNNP